MPRLELTNFTKTPRRAVDAGADPPDDVASVDALGKKLVWLAAHGGAPEEIVAISKQLQPVVLKISLRRMFEEGLPFGEYLIAGQAVEFTILDGIRKPTTRFYKLFLEQLDITFELFKLQQSYVDRWILQMKGLSARAQARVAGMVEATLQLSLGERRIVFHYIRNEMEPGEIAQLFSLPEAAVREILAKVARSARSNAREWLLRWGETTNRKPTRGKPRKRRTS